MGALTDLIAGGTKPVIGMIQLAPLPDSSRWRGSTLEAVLEPALAEAELLATNGIDALMVQNLGDIPVAPRVAAAQVAWMTRVVSEITRRYDLPVGLNLLENDAEAMFAVATAAGVDFVRIKILVGAMMTPFGIESGQAHTAIKARTRWNGDGISIFADVHDRTGTPIATSGFAEDLDFAVRLGGADGLVLTGKNHAQTMDYIREARKLLGPVPILVGGSVNADNWHEVTAVADGAIVSSSLKSSGAATGSFDPEKIRKFMATVTRSAAA
ncbi:MAG: BtpA/SgcQ family protein [Bauldia sp.]|uniref:BtpA/SgcQ family protein n=1 Tax=Bauldia sp. TaxID=2575872 RepID=UPI001D72E903|nr:BtpA/SgcQ family protein [Bauldia sp.]MCB1487997.1 BtpA/SgcQ family protein [Bauldia sp.]MCB1495459.1 BtpA/SgcQ family protein [Bauldia sp.]